MVQAKAKHILIVDDDHDLCDSLSIRFAAEGLRVSVAYDGESAIEKAMADRPDVVVMDITMPGGDGLQTCRRMELIEGFDQVPIVFHSGQDLQPIKRQIHGLGGLYVEKVENSWENILGLLKLLGVQNSDLNDLEESNQSSIICDPTSTAFAPTRDDVGPSTVEQVTSSARYRILSIEDDLEFALLLTFRLETLGFQLLHETTAAAGYRTALLESPDLILLDFNLVKSDGLYVIRRLQETNATSAIPIIALTGNSDSLIHRRLISQGASVVLSKRNISWNSLCQEVARTLPDCAANAL